jgi:phospholipase/carboxylesterase
MSLDHSMTQSSLVYQFIPGTASNGVPMVLLHGSGGDERDLVPFAAKLAPSAPMLSLRGTVGIDGGFAFFHRRPDRSIDEADLTARIPPLAGLIAASSEHHGFSSPPVVIGYSNGAIMAAALLLSHAKLFAGAILLRPLSPFREDKLVRLDATPVMIIDGEKDSRRSHGDGAELALRFDRAGATVTHQLLPVGHAMTELDERIARAWLARA